MGDIVKIFADIGEIYQKDEKRLKNEAYKYDTIKVYLCDTETRRIEPNLNISKDDLIICRFGVGANSGNLFPNSQFLSKFLLLTALSIIIMRQKRALMKPMKLKF